MTALPEVDALAARIHQTAVDHGFWDKPRNLGEMLMLVCSELAECLEEDREHKGTVYFKCPACGYTQIVQDVDYHFIPPPPPGSAMQRMMRYFRGAFAGSEQIMCEYKGPLKPEGTLVEVADAIIRLFDTGHDMASKTRFTLSQVMLIKMDYNDTRSRMHGKAY